ncbi:MAG: cytochrome c oxidase subunit II transmembrane domain-containing protein, partial [Chloroflexota bacterium]
MSLVWIIAAGLAIVLGGLLIASFTPAIFPAQGSSQSIQVDTLFRFMLAIGGMIFLLVNGVLLYSVIRFRARKGDNSDGPPIHGNTTLEFAWTIVPAIIVTVLTFYSFTVWTSIREPQANEQQVNVVGQRFAWTFNYDISAKTLPQGVTLNQLPQETQDALAGDKTMSFSSPQLHTWVGQPVHVLLDTEDVNHAFWIPGMRIKQDLLAGRETDARFTPIEPGVYRIECAELCGSGHGNMAGTVASNGDLQGSWLIVHADEQTYLREFYDPQAESVLFPPADPVALGQQILSSGKYPCATCHTLTTLGWTGNIGPHLDGIGTRAATRLSGFDGSQYIHDSV